MKPFRFDKEHSLFFCTDTIVGWQPEAQEYHHAQARSYWEARFPKRSERSFATFLRLRLPNHLHTIISSADANLSDIIRDFKCFTSESITDLIHKADNRRLLDFFAEAARFDKRGNRFKIWQGGSHPEAIETGGFFHQKLRYIHENPVRKRFVKNPEDWLYSSARNYYLHDDSVIKIKCLD